MGAVELILSIDLLPEPPPHVLVYCIESTITLEALNILSFSSNTPVIGTNLQINANVKNRGLLAANSYSVSFYDDYNDDGNPTPNELINTVNSSSPLPPGDSINYNTSKLMDSLGTRQFIAVVNYSADEDTSNNKKVGTVNVISGGGGFD